MDILDWTKAMLVKVSLYSEELCTEQIEKLSCCNLLTVLCNDGISRLKFLPPVQSKHIVKVLAEQLLQRSSPWTRSWQRSEQ